MRELLGFRAAGDALAVVVQCHVAHNDFPLRRDFGPPQQGLDPQQQLGLVDGLGHIVVGARPEALVPIPGKLPGGEHQNGQIAVSLPQLPGKGIAVHLRHHHVQHHKVHVFPVQQRQGLLSVFSGRDGIALRLQHRPQQQPGILIIVHHKNVKHPIHLLPAHYGMKT